MSAVHFTLSLHNNNFHRCDVLNIIDDNEKTIIKSITSWLEDIIQNVIVDRTLFRR